MSVNASFSVTASGTPPMYYHWETSSIFGGSYPLTDTTRITGSRFTGSYSSSLYINNVQLTDSASYRVRVSNFVGDDVSQRAVLHITSSACPPLVIFHPRNQETVELLTASFSASVVGTTPLTFQWISGSTNLSDDARIHGANSMSMVISSVQATDTGSYKLYVTNAYGAVYSYTASLILLPNAVPYYINDTSSYSVATVFGSLGLSANNEYAGVVTVGVSSGSLTTVIETTSGSESASFDAGFYSGSLLTVIVVTSGSDSASFDAGFYSGSLSTVIIVTSGSDSASFDAGFYSGSLVTIVTEQAASDAMPEFTVGLISGSLG